MKPMPLLGNGLEFEYLTSLPELYRRLLPFFLTPSTQYKLYADMEIREACMAFVIISPNEDEYEAYKIPSRVLFGNSVAMERYIQALRAITSELLNALPIEVSKQIEDN